MSKLTPLFSRTVANFHGNMPEELQDQYEAVKKALLTRFGLTISQRRARWTQLKHEKEETYIDLFHKVCAIGTAWQKKEEDYPLIWMREKFLTTLEPDVKEWVLTQNPKTGEAAAEVADTFRMGHPNLEPTHQSQQYRGWSSNASYRGNRYKRKDDADPEKSKPSGTQSEQNSKPDKDEQGRPKCFNCQQYGHMKWQCPDKKKCFAAQESPQENGSRLDIYQGRLNGKEVKKILVDTGCDRSQVHPRCLKEDYVKEGAINVEGAFATKKCPLTRVKVRMEGRSFDTTMAVNENMSFDAILGVDVTKIRALIGTKEKWPTNEDTELSGTRAAAYNGSASVTSSSDESTDSSAKTSE